jgi:hypothetical protein
MEHCEIYIPLCGPHSFYFLSFKSLHWNFRHPKSCVSCVSSKWKCSNKKTLPGCLFDGKWFSEITFQIFLYLFVIKKVDQRKNLEILYYLLIISNLILKLLVAIYFFLNIFFSISSLRNLIFILTLVLIFIIVIWFFLIIFLLKFFIYQIWSSFF